MRLAKAACVFAAFMLVSPLAASQAAADGMVHVYNQYFDEWGLSSEGSQFCLIHHNDGIQKMILSIKVQAGALDTAAKAVWLFPVPSDPQRVDLDLVRQVPHLRGETLAKVAGDKLLGDFLMISCTQIYPLLLFSATSFPLGGPGYGTDELGTKPGGGDGVVVYESVNQYGVMSELVWSGSSEEIANYVAEKDLGLPQESSALLDAYLGANYSFVVSWISDVEAFKRSAVSDGFYYSIGTMVSFPTERVFYPMRLTSAYGQTKVPLLVQVLGFVTPDPDSHKEYALNMEHLLAAEWSTAAVTELFGQDIDSRVNDRLVYTEVAVDAPSSAFTQDLWFDSGASAAERAEFVIENDWAVAVVVFLVVSMVSSALAGLWVFYGYRPVLGMLGLLGLLNVLTLVGLWIAADRLEIHRRFTRPPNGVYPSRDPWSFVVAFTVLFMATLVVAYLLLFAAIS